MGDSIVRQCPTMYVLAEWCRRTLASGTAYGGADGGIIVELICHSRPFVFNYHVVYDNTRKNDVSEVLHIPHTALTIMNRT